MNKARASARAEWSLSAGSADFDCGARENRTPDILLAKQALYQLSYGPGEKQSIG